MSDKNEVKEIDLLELFRLIGNGIKNAFLALFKAILFLIVFGIKKAHFIAIFAVAGALIGLGYHSMTKSYYSTGMVVKPNGIPGSDLIEYINDLSEVCKKGDDKTLAVALNISDTSAKKIKDIKAFAYVDVNLDGIADYVDFKNLFNPKDTTQQIIQNRCYLQVQLFENQPKEYIQKGVENYVMKNDYMVQLNEIRKKDLTEQIAEIDKEVRKLDSLQNKEYFTDDNSKAVPVGTGGYIVYTEKDKKLYYKDKLDLIRNKQALQKEFNLSEGPVTVIKSMSELAVEENPKSITIIKFGFWFGLFGFIFLLLLNFKNRILSFSTPS